MIQKGLSEVSDKLYSADRRGFYRLGTLNLSRHNYRQDLVFTPSLDNDYTTQQVENHLLEMFPEGLSLHGWLYALSSPGIHLNDGRITIDSSCAIEMLFEFIRRASFPDRPSRFQSFFAFDSLENVREFARALPIYEMKPKSAFKCDQKWLRIPQAALAFYYGHQYWSGAATSNPTWEYLLEPPVETTFLEQNMPAGVSVVGPFAGSS